jgi:penicillin-binding protein 1C
VYIPRELDGKKGRTVLEAAHRDPQSRVFWHLDEKYLGETVGVHQMAVNPEPGRHRLTLLDEQGNQLEHNFTVLQRTD